MTGCLGIKLSEMFRVSIINQPSRRRSLSAVAYLALVLALVSSLLYPMQAAAQTRDVIIIGVLAYRGKDEAIKMWTATAGYIQSIIQGPEVRIVPLDFHEVDAVVRDKKIDFVIANSSIYVELEAKYGVQRIATMKNKAFNGAYTVFGGTIFSRAGRQDISELTDIRGKKFMAVDETSLGGWHAAWREFKAAGINPARDFSRLEFGNTHDAVVYAVRDGKTDAGTVRSDTLERMAGEGRISLADFKVINERRSIRIPFLHSTRLYPEWPIASLQHTSEELSKQVSIALLNMPSESRAALNAKITGWTIPHDYQPVHDLMKELRLGPYKNYGRLTLKEALRRYWYFHLLVIAAIAAMSVVTLYIMRMNRRLLSANIEVEDARNGLEQQVAERTVELSQVNAELNLEIAVRRESEDKLRQAEKERESHLRFLQAVIDSFSDPVMVISPDYKVKLMNKAVREAFNSNTYCYHISHNADRPCDEKGCPCPLHEVLQTRKPLNVTHTHTGKDGSVVIAEITASPVFDDTGAVAYVIEVCRDITEKVRIEDEQKKLMERLFQQQKDESIATLAGGMAHDFNNILMGILGNAELLKLRLPLKPEAVEPVEVIITSVERMADLTRQMLAYAREGKYLLKTLPVADPLQKAIALSHKGSFIETDVVLQLPGDLWPVSVDENQIIQVFMNLFNNAFEATEGAHGRLTIAAENEAGRQPWRCPLHNEHPSGDYVHISIADTGHGIPGEIADRVFEPFFSTKFMGRGLGLPAALGIIRNHSGCISFTSEGGKGTVFHIYLPRADALQEKKAVGLSEAGSLKKHLFVIDDEEAILQLLRTGLKELGYKVTVAASADEAIKSFDSLREEIDVVVLDLQLPGIGGREIFRELKARRPDIRIIISTGYDRGRALEELKPYVPEEFIQKPYKLSQLTEKLEKITGRRSS